MAPAWFAVCGLVLLGLLRLFAHFEMQRDTAAVTAKVPQLVVAGLMISGGLLGLAAHGFAPLSDGIAHGPVPWVVLRDGRVPPGGQADPGRRPAGPRGRRHGTRASGAVRR